VIDRIQNPADLFVHRSNAGKVSLNEVSQRVIL
jgi:hypothetical protein